MRGVKDGPRSESGSATPASPRGVVTNAAITCEVLLCGEEVQFDDVLPLHLLDMGDVDYLEMLFELLHGSPQVVQYYLHSVVFPETTAHQATKLSASGQDLGGEMLFSRRIGFSGAPHARPSSF